MNELRFPKGFLWGAATSSYQIEGGLTNDWSEWEKSPRRVAALKKQGKNPVDFQSGLAANSWEMLDADIECLKKINANAYRFSIEWARVEPAEGRFDQAAIARYADFVKKLQAAGIEPFVTLWHWPMPLWLSQRKWEDKKIIAYFSRYAETIAKAMPTVTFWITLNEVQVYVGNGYARGNWLPQKHNPFLYLRVLKNLIAGHRAAYDTIKKIVPNARISIANPTVAFEAGTFIDALLVPLVRWFSNYYILDRIKNKLDFIGLNYYFHQRLICGIPLNKNERLSEMGWEVYPAGIYQVIMELVKRYQLPIYITETGIADKEDRQRAWYITEVLKYVHKAIADGADVRGHLIWSLIDNFEWAYGFTQKFGLFAYDLKTFERRARSSAELYATICKNNKLTL